MPARQSAWSSSRSTSSGCSFEQGHHLGIGGFVVAFRHLDLQSQGRVMLPLGLRLDLVQLLHCEGGSAFPPEGELRPAEVPLLAEGFALVTRGDGFPGVFQGLQGLTVAMQLQCDLIPLHPEAEGAGQPADGGLDDPPGPFPVPQLAAGNRLRQPIRGLGAPFRRQGLDQGDRFGMTAVPQQVHPGSAPVPGQPRITMAGHEDRQRLLGHGLLAVL